MSHLIRPTVTHLEGRSTPTAFTVIRLLDDGSADTLRPPVTQARANGDDDTITLAADGVVRLASPLGLIESGRTVAIDGGGRTSPDFFPVAVSGSNAVQILQVAAGVTAKLTGVTIRNGRGENGGGVVNAGDLTLTGCVVAANLAPVRGGGILNETSGTLTLVANAVGNNTARFGGGVRNRGTLTATDSVLESNATGGSDKGFANAALGGAA